MQPSCVTDGCDRHPVARGLCAACYRRDRTARMPACSTQGCETATHARGLCHKCYETQRLLHQAVSCRVDDCARPAAVRGMCRAHYNRERVLPGETGPCAVAGCQRSARSLGYCPAHYRRLRKHGDATFYRGGTQAEIAGRNGNGAGSILEGYHVLSGMLGHPLASARGMVRAHRLVLWKAIGPGTHPCHHCGALVDWSLRNTALPGTLVVDHLDGNKLNNALENLVPSCIPCNSARTPKAKG